MRYSPYDWNENVRQRNDYIDEQLKEGSPVVSLSYDDGVLMLSVRRTQRKIYEIYDKLIFSGVGRQSDIEAIRTAAIDFAHREGFQRSPDDVTIQRLVGFWVSPAIKKAHADPFAAPVVMRAIFAELGKTFAQDQYFVVSYDGEFTEHSGCAVIGGTEFAEDRMREHMSAILGEEPPDLARALSVALSSWGVGRQSLEPDESEDVDAPTSAQMDQSREQFLRETLNSDWVVEAAVLKRNTSRESRFRLLTEAELTSVLSKYPKQDPE